MNCIILMYFINEFHPVPISVKVAIWGLYIAKVVLSFVSDWLEKDIKKSEEQLRNNIIVNHVLDITEGRSQSNTND